MDKHWKISIVLEKGYMREKYIKVGNSEWDSKLGEAEWLMLNINFVLYFNTTVGDEDNKNAEGW